MKLSIAALALAGAMAACSVHSPHQHGAMETPAVPPRDRSQLFAREMDTGMTKMMHDMHAAGHSGNPEIDFLSMMIPHHEGAVEMARLLLIHGRDPLTRQLAEEIIASQTAEINAMKQRLALLRRAEDANPDSFPPLHGTRGE
jgi:uncharacterized protein (DUF305 family)